MWLQQPKVNWRINSPITAEASKGLAGRGGTGRGARLVEGGDEPAGRWSGRSHERRTRQAGGAKSDADESQGICDPRNVVFVGLAGRHWPGHLARSQGQKTQAHNRSPAASTIARTSLPRPQATETVDSNSMGAKLLIEKASWTLVDQGVVSFGNFLLNLLLARTLSEQEYGEFALFLGAIFILRTIDYSLISYPLSLRLCVASDEERAGLVGNTILLAAALVSCWSWLWRLEQRCLASMKSFCRHVLCYLCWQAQETSRRCLLADFRYRAAVVGDGIAYVGQVPLVALLAWLDVITLPGRALYDVGDLRHRRLGACIEAPICMAGSCRSAAIGP